MAFSLGFHAFLKLLSEGATASRSPFMSGKPPVRMGEVGAAELEGAALGLCFRRPAQGSL